MPLGCLLIFETAVYRQKHSTRIPDGKQSVKQFLSMSTLCYSCNGLNKVGMVETEGMGEGNGRLSLLVASFTVWVFVHF